jgi:hypothetical protein
LEEAAVFDQDAARRIGGGHVGDGVGIFAQRFAIFFVSGETGESD